jgi:hypothetical protein
MTEDFRVEINGLDTLRKFLKFFDPCATAAPRAIFTIGQISGVEMAVKFKVTDGPKHLSVAFKDAKGNPAVVDGVPLWGTSDPAIGTLTPSTDGLSAEWELGPAPVVGQINVAADADLGSGVTQITGTLDVELIAGDATTVEISVS